MARALIIGCQGQDGRLLTESLSQAGHEVVGWGKTDGFSNGNYAPGHVDTGNYATVHRIISDFRPHEVYYLAAYHQSAQEQTVDEAELIDRSINTHVQDLKNFLEAIRSACPDTRLFYPASSHIFGMAPDPVQDEGTPIAPTCIYGLTKAAGLFLCRYYRRKYHLFAAGGILYNHESCYRDAQFLTQKVCRGALAIKGGTADTLVLGDLKAAVDWGYAPDFVDAFQRILRLETADDFVVATGQAHTVEEFVAIVFKYLGLDWRQHVQQDPTLIAKERRTLVGDAGKLRQATGWRPSLGFEEMAVALVEQGMGQGPSGERR